MVSAKGGMDIEAVAAEDPDALVKRHIDPTRAVRRRRGAADRRRRRARRGRPRRRPPRCWRSWPRWRATEDATLIEVNPLIVTADREVVALDAKVTIDGNAALPPPGPGRDRRHGRGPAGGDGEGEGPHLRQARRQRRHPRQRRRALHVDPRRRRPGGRRAGQLPRRRRRLESRGDRRRARSDHLRRARSRAILFNIFGGITRCDEIAKGIVTASSQIDLDVPLVVRLDGTNSEEGLAILAEADLPNLHQEKTMLGRRPPRRRAGGGAA